MTQGLNTEAPWASCCARDVGRVQCGCGVPCSKNKKSPQKVYWETCYGWATLTISALSFPQFTQMHSRIFFTLMRKPAQTISNRRRNKLAVRAYQGEIRDVRARCGRSAPGTLPYPRHRLHT